jgi:hypothetical protein
MPSSQDDTDGLNRPIPMTVFPHSNQTAPPVRDTVSATLQHEDLVRHELDTF